MKNPQHAIFRPPNPSEDSCIAAIQLANERYHQRLRTERIDEEPTEPSRYQAVDSDLPEIFWSENR